MVGLPACGKSYFALHYYSEYKYVCMDVIKNKKKMLEIYLDYIKDGYQIVVDNTNTKKEQRKEFIEIAQKNKYKILEILCIYILLHLKEFWSYQLLILISF